MPRTAPLPRRSAAVVFATALATLSACGGSDDGADSAAPSSSVASSSAAEDSGSESSAPAEETQQITATEEDFSISLDSTDLAAGDYEIEVVNDGGATHDLVVEQDGEDVAASEDIAPGNTGTVSVSLEPGEYVFYCSIGNHRAMGMEVTVTVT